MPAAHRTLVRLHQQAFGDSWLLLGIAVAGVWGIWRGLIQRRTTDTVAGLALAVAMIIAALVVISEPDRTVGRAAQLTNAAGLQVLSAGVGTPGGDPRQSLADALHGIFTTTVHDPWCALEFGSVDYCNQHTGAAAPATNGEVWLAYPAQSSQRGRLHDLVAGSGSGNSTVKKVLGLGTLPVNPVSGILALTQGGPRKLPKDVERLVKKDPGRVQMQEGGGTFARLALLVMIAIGLLGAVALYSYLGVRLLLAAGMGLVLLLIAPAMLIAPAFGESGRATFLAWVQRLIGAVVAKLVFAIFLTVVLAAGQVFHAVDLGWFGSWLLSAAFWWGVFIKRQEIVGFVSHGMPHRDHGGLGSALAQGYYAMALGRGARQIAGAVTQPARRGAQAVGANRAEGQEARTAAVRELAQERLDEHGRQALEHDQTGARQVVGHRDQVRGELQAVDRRLRGFDEVVAQAHATGRAEPSPTPTQRQLLDHRDRLRTVLADPVAGGAEQTVRHAERNQALTGQPVTGRDLDVYRARRATELTDGRPDDDDAHLRAAGIEPEHYATADPTTREAMLAQVQTHLHSERALHAASSPDRGPNAQAHGLVDEDELRRRTQDHRMRMRAERRRERAQRGVYRSR